MRIRFSVILLLVTLCIVTEAGALRTAPKSESRKLSSAVQRHPGDTELRCRLVSALLAECDTVGAERELDYAMNMQFSPCLLVHKATLALQRGRTSVAAGYCAEAVQKGLLPEDECLVWRVDSLSGGMVSMRLKMSAQADKTNVAALSGLAQLNLIRGDTAGAVSCITEAAVRGDSTLFSRLDELTTIVPADSSGYQITGTIPFTRNFGKIEISGTLNGLKVKFELDTAAATSTISGVETLFMLKNDYIRKDEVIDDHIIIAREVDFGNGVVLRGIRLYHIRKQDAPVILCLKDLSALGVPRINDSGKCVELLSVVGTDSVHSNDNQ